MKWKLLEIKMDYETKNLEFDKCKELVGHYQK